MIQFKVCSLRLHNVILRFYLMMAGAIALGFAGQFTLAALFAGTMAILTILGVSIQFGTQNAKKSGKIISMPSKQKAELQKMG